MAIYGRAKNSPKTDNFFVQNVHFLNELASSIVKNLAKAVWPYEIWMLCSLLGVSYTIINDVVYTLQWSKKRNLTARELQIIFPDDSKTFNQGL